MFNNLFAYSSVLRRHCDGPLAEERATYLEGLLATGLALQTVLRRASACLHVAEELENWAPDHCFTMAEVESLVTAMATKRVASGHALSPKWPAQRFHVAATDLLRSIGRLVVASSPPVDRYDDELADFITTQLPEKWSAATCTIAKWQVSRFLEYLEHRNVSLADVTPSDVDAYYRHMAQRWSRSSLRTSAKMLRAWFRHCESRKWSSVGLADAVQIPRVYQHEGLPLGPTWQQVSQMLTSTSGDDSASIRDHAILLLLSVYALRSGEVRRLRLDDIDWQRDRIRIIRSKSLRVEILPVDVRVGNAIARYLRDGRPRSSSNVIFLTLRGPHRPLSAGGLYNVVKRQLSNSPSLKRGRGPHGLRHACARHLLESGRSFKEVGDHLGHRSPDATRYYAKVDLGALRRVAVDDLGGLA